MAKWTKIDDGPVLSKSFEPTRLEIARKTRGMRVMDVAKRVDVSPATVDRWERGITCPSLEKCKDLAAVLGFPLGFLFLERVQGIRGCSDSRLNFSLKAE